MKPSRIRLAVMAAVLAGYAAVYLADLPGLRAGALSWQFTPALLALGWAALFLLAMFAAAALFGRAYCSFLCPAGIAQELAFRLGKTLRLAKTSFVPAAPVRVVMAATALLLALGLPLAANLLDPVGWFGRLAAPAAELLRDIAHGSQYAAGYAGPAGVGIAAAAAVLFAVPLFKGRWFCDRLCPAGAALGVISSLSARKIAVDAAACVSCRACEKTCPTRCLDGRRKRVETERCVLCLSCLDACPKGAVTYRRAESGSRRRALAGGLAWLGTLAFLSARSLRAGLLPFAGPAAAVIPPGAGDAREYFQKCLGCQSCVAACPVGILRPLPPGMQPGVRFDLGYCQYECNACSQACPTGALRPLPLEEKKLTRIAKTGFAIESCVVLTEGNACGACAEVCPTHALIMAGQGEGLPTKPEFHPDHCIGCGACLLVCPAHPPVFALAGLRRHEAALPPRRAAPGDEGFDFGDGAAEFPF